MASDQEANADNLGIFFNLLDNNGMLNVLIRITHLNEVILISTHNIQFHDIIRKFP